MKGLILLIIAFQISGILANCSEPANYFFFPKYKKQAGIEIGLSIARLPSKVVEEEINTLPIINFDYRQGLFKNTTLNAQLSTNYINNMGAVGFQYTFLNRAFSIGIGENTSLWYGHMEQEGFKLKAGGILIRSNITAGANFKDFYVVFAFEGQYGYMFTYSDDTFVGRGRQPNSAYIFRMAIEQPLWNNHWVSIGLKLNYARFFYQAWLAYSTLDEYLLYPEFSFSFIL